MTNALKIIIKKILITIKLITNINKNIKGFNNMPIYEFKCSRCEELLELLVMNSNDEKFELKCEKCGSYELERVLSFTNYAMKSASANPTQNSCSTTRTCSSGSCTTYTIPGVE